MSVPTNVQIIEHGGVPAFAVVPYDEYLALVKPLEVYIPHGVVDFMIENDVTIFTAWRKHLGKTQQQVATAMGVPQSSVARIESGKYQSHASSISRYASALGVMPEQLTL